MTTAQRVEHALTCSTDWLSVPVRRVGDDHRGAFLFGECLASGTALTRALSAESNALPLRLARLSTLPGRYGVAVFDGDAVIVAGDLVGIIRVWFRRVEGATRFALSPLALVEQGEPQVDPRSLAARLFLPDFAGGLPGGSLFHGVTELRPDEALLIRGGGAEVVDRSPTYGRRGFAEASDALRDALTIAVEERVSDTDTVSADLSGGLDSSSLALLAARHRAAPVRAITYADPFACNDDDLAYAQRLASSTSGLDQHVVTGGPDTLPFSHMDEAPFTDYPSLDTILHARNRFRLAPAVVSGVHLVGDGGDVVLGAPLTYLADLARLSTGSAFARECAGWARLRHRPVHRVVRAALAAARTSYPGALSVLAARLESPENSPLSGRTPAVEGHIAWAALSPAVRWGTPAARAGAAELLRHTAESGTDDGGADAHALRSIRWHAFASRSFLQMTERIGVRVAMPFFDNQVVAACLSVPATERVSVTGAKPLLGAALAGPLPRELFARRTKGDYSAGEYHGLRRNAAHVRELLNKSRLADLGIIQPEEVRRDLDIAISGGYVPMGALSEIIAAEVWLRALDEHTKGL